MKQTLTDRGLKALKPQAKVYEIMDSEVRGFGVRVLPSGRLSFILFRRWPGSKNPARRALGFYPEMTLAKAREKARAWRELAERGLDPAKEEKRLREAVIEATRAKEAASFGAALERYLEAKAKLKSTSNVKRELMRELADWRDKPLVDISASDVRAAVERIMDRGARTQAHYLLDKLKTFFTWCVDSGSFGLDASPAAKLKGKILIGPKNIRSRVLSNDELAAYWRASEAMGYPFGKLFQLLALTALRRDEAADAQWSEIDAGLWTVPAARMKGGAAHVISLTSDLLAFLDGLPRFTGGDFLFSTTGGRRPVSGFSKAKARLDGLMRADLEVQGKSFNAFVIHDIRRTVRTRLSALPIEQHVRELLLAHAQPGLHKVYDLHAYQDEKRRGLELWHEKLRRIVAPVETSVIAFPNAKETTRTLSLSVARTGGA